jgi:hypothetical protein
VPPTADASSTSLAGAVDELREVLSRSGSSRLRGPRRTCVLVATPVATKRRLSGTGMKQAQPSSCSNWAFRVGRRGLEPLTPCASCRNGPSSGVHRRPCTTSEQVLLSMTVPTRSPPDARLAVNLAVKLRNRTRTNEASWLSERGTIARVAARLGPLPPAHCSRYAGTRSRLRDVHGRTTDLIGDSVVARTSVGILRACLSRSCVPPRSGSSGRRMLIRLPIVLATECSQPPGSPLRRRVIRPQRVRRSVKQLVSQTARIFDASLLVEHL